MATKTAVQTAVQVQSESELVSPAQLAMLRRESQPVVKHMLDQIEDLVVEEPAQYAIADSLLSKITSAKRIVEGKFRPMLDHFNRGLGLLRGLQHELLDPLVEGEKSLREKMRQFKIEEQRQIYEAQRVQAAEAARIRREEEEKERQLAAARTTQMREKIQAKAAELATQRMMVESAPEPEIVKVAGSTTRKVRKWRVVDMAALAASAIDPEGVVPIEVLMVNAEVVNTQFRVDPVGVAEWPGIGIWEDIVIVGRR